MQEPPRGILGNINMANLANKQKENENVQRKTNACKTGRRISNSQY